MLKHNKNVKQWCFINKTVHVIKLRKHGFLKKKKTRWFCIANQWVEIFELQCWEEITNPNERILIFSYRGSFEYGTH